MTSPLFPSDLPAGSSNWNTRDRENLIVDRTDRMKPWMTPVGHLVASRIPTYVHFNSHYAGYAPVSVELFLKLNNSPEHRNLHIFSSW